MRYIHRDPFEDYDDDEWEPGVRVFKAFLKFGVFEAFATVSSLLCDKTMKGSYVFDGSFLP